MKWKPIETCPQDGLFVVHEGGAVRVMFRERGAWVSTSVALDAWGDPTVAVKVRETGVYEPTHWMDVAELLALPGLPEAGEAGACDSDS